MEIKTPTKFESFQHGNCTIYAVENIADAGNKPITRLEQRYQLAFQNRKIGFVRQMAAQQAQQRISREIRVQRVHGVQPAADVCIPTDDGLQYRIEKITYHTETLPQTMDLLLARLERDYDITAVS